MTFATRATTKIDDAQAQIAHLREQVEALMKDRVTPTVADFAGRAETAVNNARGMMRNQTRAVSGRVREQPLMAIVVAAAAGWIIGRVMR